MTKQVKENKLVIREIKENLKAGPITVPQELLLILWGRGDLLGLYFSLSLLSRMRLDFIRQADLAGLSGMSYLSYLKKRKELEEFGLIRVEIEKHNLTRIYLDSEKLWGLIKFIRPSYKNYKTPPATMSLLEVKENIANTRKSLVELVGKINNGEKNFVFSHNIYNTNNNKSPNLVSNTNTVSDDSSSKVYCAKTYPKEDYKLVLDAFREYKGVEIAGPEVAYHCRAIKMMFQAGRSPQQIADFMKWLHSKQGDRDMAWVRTWTIWTVQKKIAEFVAGKLEPRSKKEEYQKYGE